MTYLTDLADVLRAAGLRVVEIPGWKSRGRPGLFAPQGNLWHHTGGAADGRAYAEWMATTGRPDLPPPLCQLAVGRDGTVYVCAAGRANHAGVAKASGPCPAGDGNTLYLGWECMNTGTEGWTPAQYHAMRVGAAATSTHYGWGAGHNRAHRETSVTGKWDPGQLDMDKFRTDVRATMNGDDVAAEDVWQYPINGADDRYASNVLAQVFDRTARIEQALKALAAGISPTVKAAVDAALDEKLPAALADAVVDVQVNVNGVNQ